MRGEEKFKSLVEQGPAGRPVWGRWGREGTRNCLRPSERGHGEERKDVWEEGAGTYLLRTLLLSEHFILLGDDLCLVLEDESERKADEKGRGCHHPDDISGDFCGALEERRSV